MAKILSRLVVHYSQGGVIYGHYFAFQLKSVRSQKLHERSLPEHAVAAPHMHAQSAVQSAETFISAVFRGKKGSSRSLLSWGSFHPLMPP